MVAMLGRRARMPPLDFGQGVNQIRGSRGLSQRRNRPMYSAASFTGLPFLAGMKLAAPFAVIARKIARVLDWRP